IVSVRGPFDAALAVVKELAAAGEATLVNSVNPLRLEGQKTAAFEVCEALGDAPDALFIPVGNAGNITAYWKGFVEATGAGMARRRPRMFGYQAEGAAPLVSGRPIAEPETLATAIRIGNPASWKGAVAARDESGGAIEAVSDDEILAAYRFAARCEGVFVEPASAAAIAGLRKRAKAGGLEGVRQVVCVLTGNGLKDPDRARTLAGEIDEVDASADAGRARPGLERRGDRRRGRRGERPPRRAAGSALAAACRERGRRPRRQRRGGALRCVHGRGPRRRRPGRDPHRVPAGVAHLPA